MMIQFIIFAIQCCSKPCITGAWERGKYGYKCTNCGTFTES